VITGDGVITGDMVATAQAAMVGGDACSASITPDDGTDCLSY
jgi:hypothetical protein